MVPLPGVTAELAQRTADMMRNRNFNVNVMELNEVGDIADLANKENIMVMCSTAGEGDMPSTAESFWEFINDPSIDVSEQPMKNVKLSSFGLGDTSYRYFNKSVLDIEKRFIELGATPVIETGLGNDQDDDKYESVDFGVRCRPAQLRPARLVWLADKRAGSERELHLNIYFHIDCLHPVA